MDVINCRQTLSQLEDKVKRDTQSFDTDSRALEMDEETTTPKLQLKVSFLNEEVRCLSLELKNKIKENEMLKVAKSKLTKEWYDTIEHTERKNRSKIMQTEELKQKEGELASIKHKLTDKKKKLCEKKKELDMKSARLIQLQNELEDMKQMFKHLQEEMDQRMFDSCVCAQPSVKFLKERVSHNNVS